MVVLMTRRNWTVRSVGASLYDDVDDGARCTQSRERWCRSSVITLNLRLVRDGHHSRIWRAGARRDQLHSGETDERDSNAK